MLERAVVKAVLSVSHNRDPGLHGLLNRIGLDPGLRCQNSKYIQRDRVIYVSDFFSFLGIKVRSPEFRHLSP